MPVRTQTGKTLEAFFPQISTPSPLQIWAGTVQLESCAQLHILEDVTGAGKTEAAVLLAYRMMEAGLADGFFIGLPTMATANAMYKRLQSVYRLLFAGIPSLVLAHGSRDLVAEFARSVLPETADEHDGAQADETASARCAAWLADHKKRALLAPAGVGTIDQAMLAVLHSRHQSIRLLGLYRKVLVIDEVHACDAYMQKVLETLLEFHARAGGSAILLSATLPGHLKKALVAAFARGREVAGGAGIIASPAYPLATSWVEQAPNDPSMTALSSRSDVCRRVMVGYGTNSEAIVAEIHDALMSGKCVCWVRNTVADALDAMRLFMGGPAHPPLLFHARFALGDRLTTEETILDLFGPQSTSEQRRGRLVIATQVIEQSLDVDFDLVVSDLAPIDRLIQRGGRMHRHVRNHRGDRLQAGGADERGEPRLLVFGPEFVDTPDAGWYKAVFPRAAAVYPDHAQLWRTARELQTGSYAMPEDARRLIEAVFAQDDLDMPTGLRGNAARAEGQALADASIAHSNTLKFANGYVRGDVVDWWSDARTPSRLGEASQGVVLGRWEGNRLVPWAEGGEHAWAYSTVRVAERMIQRAVEPDPGLRRDEYERVRLSLPAEGRWSVLLGMDQVDDGSWDARALPAARQGERQLTPRRWRYDKAMGLRLADDAGQTTEGE